MREKIRLIIPSAKLVPAELQNLGKLPAIIYPINQKIVFDYLFEQYYATCSGIDVICYEAADKVHRRLSRYVSDKVSIKDLPVLGDLGHTIYYSLKEVNESVVINFADTIVFDDITKFCGDSFFYTEEYLSDTWTYYEMANGEITSIYDKLDGTDSSEKKRFFVGVFMITDPQFFCLCLEEAFRNSDYGMSSFYYALCLYSKKRPLEEIHTNNWFDIGHADTYNRSRIEVRAREFNQITVDRDRGIIRKSSEDKDKFIGEILWYLKLPAAIEYVRPRIFEYSTQYANPYVSMEYYAYHTVHELFLYGDLSRNQWRDIFRRILFVCKDFQMYRVAKGNNIIPDLEEMYLTKTFQRFDRLRKDKRFTAFFEHSMKINGKSYKSLDSICSILEDVIPGLLYDVEEFCIIHGDLCFANIMIDSNFSFIKVIDPRGKFGSYDIYGDPRYELAKLFHSVDGKYDFIIKDLFSVNYDIETAEIQYAILDRKRDYDLYTDFRDVFKAEIGEDLKKIELIEALLFLSMIPLHNENFSHQIVMLATGMEILSRVVDITE